MANSEISTFIRELLYDYDCVIIPGFGGLVGQPQAATVNPVSKQLFPPSKKIAFNQNLQHNDGLLTSYISRKKSCSYAEALLAANRFTQEIQKLLQANQNIVIDGVGSFRIDAAEKLIFSPEKTDTFLYESFGLKPVAAIPIAVAAEKENKAPKIIERADTVAPLLITEPTKPVVAETPAEKAEKVRKKKLGAPFIIASSVVVLFSFFTMFLASYNIQLPFLQNDSSQTSSFANTTYVHTKPVTEVKTEPKATLTEEQTQTQETVNETQTEQNAAETTATPENEPIKTTEAKKDVTTPAETTSGQLPLTREEDLAEGYYVIAGAFYYEKNAIKMLDKLKSNGYTEAMFAGKTAETQLLRVAYLRVDSRMEAERELNKIRGEKNQDAWVLHLRHR
ncbi:MAG: SPOR domain-containing protein [Bacteroidia bacterium]|nr:SPOR domain-containing protein [Bacteroidia bacterium]